MLEIIIHFSIRQRSEKELRVILPKCDKVTLLNNLQGWKGCEYVEKNPCYLKKTPWFSYRSKFRKEKSILTPATWVCFWKCVSMKASELCPKSIGLLTKVKQFTFGFWKGFCGRQCFLLKCLLGKRMEYCWNIYRPIEWILMECPVAWFVIYAWYIIVNFTYVCRLSQSYMTNDLTAIYSIHLYSPLIWKGIWFECVNCKTLFKWYINEVGLTKDY